MARFSSINHLDNIITYSLWLIFDADGNVRLTRGEPSIDRNERGLSLSVALPLALFSTPQLRASITVEDPAQQVVIDTTAAAEAVKQAIGMDVDLRVVAPETGD